MARDPSERAADGTPASPQRETDSTEAGTSSLSKLARGLLLATVGVVALGVPALWKFGVAPSRLSFVAALLAVVGLLVHARSRDPIHRSPERAALFGVFVFWLAAYSLTRVPMPTPFNEPVLQAEAFLKGHVWVDEPPAYIERVNWQGHTYLMHPPLAAVLLMPLVAVSGESTDQTAAAVVIGAVEVTLAWRLLGLLGVATVARLWLTAFFGFGTTVWYEATLGNSWDFVLLVAMGMNLLVLNETFAKRRPLLVGALAGVATLARNDAFLVFPVYALLLCAAGLRWRELRGLLPGFVGAVIAYVSFNLARYSPAVIDITLWIYNDPELLARGGRPFSLGYLPYNLYTLLFMAPNHNASFPFIHPHPEGQALMLTSPAFVLALRPSFHRPVVRLLILACFLAMLPSLLIYANGVSQFGTRYYLQVFPYLLALVALGAPRRLDQLSRVLIGISIVLVTYGTWHIRVLGWG